jgi:hypothetical protein
MRDVCITLKRPLTYHAKIVNGERSREKRRGGSELQRVVAEVIDLWANEHPDGVEGALRKFMAGDPIEYFDRTIAPSVRRGGGHRAARQQYFAVLHRRFQLKIPIVIHALGLDLDLPHEAQCLCAFYATAHYLASLNKIDLPRPDYVSLAQV